MGRGWKTYLGAAALAVLGVVDIANGDVQSGVEKVVAAFTVFGLRHAVAGK